MWILDPLSQTATMRIRIQEIKKIFLNYKDNKENIKCFVCSLVTFHSINFEKITAYLSKFNLKNVLKN